MKTCLPNEQDKQSGWNTISHFDFCLVVPEAFRFVNTLG